MAAETMDALITAPGNTAVVAQVPIPQAGLNEIRIKVHSIALNPVDALYAITMQVAAPGRVIGSDIAGHIDQIGQGVPGGKWAIGDRVAGLLQGATSANNLPGGFATYAILEADLAIRIPDDVSFDEAVTVPLCGLTAAQALYNRLRLPTPFPFPESQYKASTLDIKPILLIYSASTSLGLFTLELARLLRTPSNTPYTIVATASPKHHEKLKALGADAVYDYNDSTWADKVKNEWPQGIDYALDCISQGPTTGIISQLFNTRADSQKIIAVIRAAAWNKATVRSDVRALYGAVWEGLGHEIIYNGNAMAAPPHLRALTVAFYEWLAAGDASNPRKLPISPNPVRLMPGGLNRVPLDGFALLGGGDMHSRRNGESKEEHMKPISGEKLSPAEHFSFQLPLRADCSSAHEQSFSSHGRSRNHPASHSRNHSTPHTRNHSTSQGDHKANNGATFYQGAHGFHIEQQYNTVNQYTANPELASLMNPILDASHTRNRKLSPPDSTCLPGTREDVIKKVESWADAGVLFERQHIMWIYGYVGCGKSSLAQTVAEIYARKGRLAASFFFFLGSDARSSTIRFAATVAIQICAAIPAIIPYLEKAVKPHAGILTTFSLGAQFEHLVYEPLRKFGRWNVLSGSLFRTPYLIIIDRLDECNDREEVAAFIEHMLQFFKNNPWTPLRFLFTSCVEEHIRTRLDSDQVYLFNLIDHTSLADIMAVARATFAVAAKHDRVIQTVGHWPSEEDRRKLVEHSGGSLIFMATILKFIVRPNNDGLTPMKRLPLALDISPGLDGLYAQALGRAEGLPYFSEIITALVLFVRSPYILQLSRALGIETFEAVRVLVRLHSALHVPGDDLTPVTICHTSFRDFLQSESRTGRFFIPPSCHELVYARVFAACAMDPPLVKVVATIVLSRQPLSINLLAALLGFEHSEIILALNSVGPLFNVPNGYDDLITPCDISLLAFLQTKTRSGSAYVSSLYQETLAYACFEVIAHPSDHEAAVHYARSHAIGHWHAFLDTLSFDVARLKDQVNVTLSQLRQMFSTKEIGIVDVILTIIFTLSGASIEVSSTLSVDVFARRCHLPGAPEHAILIAQVLNSFAQLGGGYRSLPDIQPDIVDYLSQKALWSPSLREHHVIVNAHIRLLLMQDASPDASATLKALCHRGTLEVRAERSPLFISEFTKFVICKKMKELERGQDAVGIVCILDSALAANATLDGLYAQIIGHADRSVPFLESFLSTTALVEEPLTLDQLSRFLHVKTGQIRSLLERLRGIIGLPLHDWDKVELPTSLRQVLRSETRAGRFFVGSPSCFRTVAVACLQLWVEGRSPERTTRGPQILYDYACEHFSTHWNASLVNLPINHMTRSKELATVIELLGRHCSINALHILLRAYLDKGRGVFQDVGNGRRSKRVPYMTHEKQQAWALETDFFISAKVINVLEQHFQSLGRLVTPEDLVEGPIAQALDAYTKSSGATSLDESRSSIYSTWHWPCRTLPSDIQQ